MEEDKQTYIYLYKIVNVTENSGTEINYRSRWSTGKDGEGGILDTRYLNFDEFALFLSERLKADKRLQVINGLPIKHISEKSPISLFKLTVEGRVIRSYEPLSEEELRKLQTKVLEKIVAEESKINP